MLWILVYNSNVIFETCLFQSLKGVQMLWITSKSQSNKSRKSFQSLKGFQMLWIQKYLSGREVTKNVSIPKRVSDALNQGLSRNSLRNCMFQSLKGFQMLWILVLAAQYIWLNKFQSLKGFQMLWIAKYLSNCLSHSPFQSLKGFQMLWICCA